MLPGDRLICAFVETQLSGAEFKSWPLHVTIVPWFRLSDASGAVAYGLSQALITFEPFKAVADGEAQFGPRKDRLVRLLKEPTPFTKIEAKVRTYLHKKRALLLDETTKRPPRFRPHVTVQPRASFRQGEVFQCDRLYIVEQKGHYKSVVKEVVLHVQTEA